VHFGSGNVTDLQAEKLKSSFYIKIPVFYNIVFSPATPLSTFRMRLRDNRPPIANQNLAKEPKLNK
jgi:hypothetical protein